MKKIFLNEAENSGTGTVMNFLDQNLKIKKTTKQLKHRNITNEILWIYGTQSLQKYHRLLLVCINNT